MLNKFGDVFQSFKQVWESLKNFYVNIENWKVHAPLPPLGEKLGGIVLTLIYMVYELSPGRSRVGTCLLYKWRRKIKCLKE